MGNNDGIIEGLMNKNIILPIKDGQFSFAFGNEIALCLDEKYYILNCDAKLWELVKAKVDEVGKNNVAEIKAFWKETSKSYDISGWSNEFEELI